MARYDVCVLCLTYEYGRDRNDPSASASAGASAVLLAVARNGLDDVRAALCPPHRTFIDSRLEQKQSAPMNAKSS